MTKPNELARPTIKDTALCRVPVWAFNITVGRVFGKKQTVEFDSDIEEEELAEGSSSGADDFEVLEKGKTTAQNGNGKALRRKKSSKGR